jgi:hypothetical protein
VDAMQPTEEKPTRKIILCGDCFEKNIRIKELQSTISALKAGLRDIPCSCPNPDGSYPHDETNGYCAYSMAQKLLTLPVKEKFTQGEDGSGHDLCHSCARHYSTCPIEPLRPVVDCVEYRVKKNSFG